MILFAVYQFTFSWSDIPVSWLENVFSWLGNQVENTLPDGLLKSMIISGVIDGVGGVLGFVPLIMFMFFSIAILEDSGYLARVAFMMDRIFRIFGLHGSSVMPFIVSGGIAGGCAVPGVMATRTLRSPKERMATLLTVPFMNCGAKLPVLALLIGAFFSENKGHVYVFIYHAVLGCRPDCRQIPPLNRPARRPHAVCHGAASVPVSHPAGLLIHTWERTYQYIKKAGTVILGISILLWALMTFPGLPEEQAAFYEQQRQAVHEQR